MITFENKDCMDAMKEFPDKFFDLAIVDPPYGDALDTHTHTHGATASEARIADLKSTNATRKNGERISSAEAEARSISSNTSRKVERTGGTWAAKYAKKS